ncbi:MAG: hypothetical protein RLZZ584_2010 [Pseudomonadota bacterium]
MLAQVGAHVADGALTCVPRGRVDDSGYTRQGSERAHLTMYAACHNKSCRQDHLVSR